jgi:hypothetical protein
MGMGMGMGLPTTQAELGHAALKVGGSVLSGMRTLGGLALTAARSRVVPSSLSSLSSATATTASSPGVASRHGAGAGEGEGVVRLFSRSAPSEGGAGAGAGVGEREREREREESRRERRYSSTTTTTMSSGVSPGLVVSVGGGGGGGSSVYPFTTPALHVPEGGCWVTVVDLAALWTRRGREETVAEFQVGRDKDKDKQVAGLRFSSDGGAVVVVPRDGQVMQVFQLRIGPAGGKVAGEGDAEKRGKRSSVAGSGVARREARTAVHVYDLRRGRTSAVVEAVECTGDGRWAAIATRKRTVHVFPVNPYGGKPDHRSHLEGRVRNVGELVSRLFISRL